MYSILCVKEEEKVFRGPNSLLRFISYRSLSECAFVECILDEWFVLEDEWLES